jgi:hypothetical protein
MWQFFLYYNLNEVLFLTSPIFSVLPKDNQVLAHLIVPPHGAGKIKKGQSVVIKLVSYPYQEFGKPIGKVKSISLIPSQNEYLIMVD